MTDNKLISKSLDTTKIDNNSTEIAQKLIDTEDVEESKDLTALFNLNVQKRNAVRIMKMNDLLDKVTDKINERFEKTLDNFSNDDLIKYMQVTENALDKASKRLADVKETPTIEYQQNNQVNINIGDTISKDSRAKITEYVKAVLNSRSVEGDNE